MRKTIFALSALAVLLSSACVIAVVDSGSGGRYVPRAMFRKTLDLDPGAAVTLENFDGDIEVSGWEEKRIEVLAETGREGPLSPGIHFLGRRVPPPDVEVTSTPGTVRIRTKEDGYGAGQERVDYFLRVPRSVNLDSIRNGRGRISVSDVYGRALLDGEEGEIRVRNYSGSLDIRLGTGSVEAETLDLRPQDNIRIKVERGDIVLSLEPGAEAQIIAEAPEGGINSELDLGQPLPAKKVSAKLGSGQASIELTAVQGDIRIRKVEETP
jgi:hypothetical protein